MRWIEASIDRVERITSPAVRVWEKIADVERLRILMPGIESIRDDGARTVWTLAEQGAGGIRVRPRATVRLRFEPPERLHIDGDPDPEDNARITGRIELDAEGPHTLAHARLVLAIALPLPLLVLPIARSVVQRRVDRMADRLLANLRDLTS